MRKKYSKLLAIVLIIVQFISALCVVHATDSNEVAKDSKELATLKSLGLIAEDYKETQEPITRAEAVYHIVNKIFEGNITANEQIFKDINPGEQYYNAINTAGMMGIVSGTGQGYFEPDAPLDIEHLKYIVYDVLGYGPIKSISNYNNIEKTLQIFSRVQRTDEGKVTKKGFVDALYNMYHAKCANISWQTSTEFKLNMDDAEILLNKYDIYYDEGVLESYDIQSLRGKFMDDFALINGNYYRILKADNQIKIGMAVKYYYEKNDSTSEDTLLFVQENKNDMYLLDIEDVRGFSMSQIQYYDNDARKTKNLRISPTADVTINGYPMSPFDPESILKMAGKICAIDNNKDGSFDCLLIEAGDSYLVSTIDSSNLIIYDKRGKKPLDLSDYSEIKIINNGKEIGISEIPLMCVVNAFLTKETALIQVSTAKFGGIISATSDDEYLIYDKSYKLAPDYETNLSNNFKYTPILKPGTKAMFYLDINDRIVAADTEGYDEFSYGLVISCASTWRLSQFSIYEQNGKITIYDCADKVKYNGVREECENVVEKFKNNVNNATQKSKLIKFKLDDSNKLKEIYDVYSEDVEKKVVMNHKYESKTIWRNAQMFINETDRKSNITNTSYGLKSDTIIFQVPSTFASQAEESYEEDDFSVITKQNLVEDDIDYINTEIYDADSANGASVVLIKRMITENWTSNYSFMYVNDVRSELKDDDYVKVIRGILGDKETKLYAESDEVLEAVKEGDVLQIIFNANNEIKYIKILFRMSQEKPDGNEAYYADNDNDGIKETYITQYEGNEYGLITVCEESKNSSQVYNNCVTVYGTLLDRNESGFTVAYTGDRTNYIPFYNLTKNIIVCERDNIGDYYRIGSFDELVESSNNSLDGSKVLVMTRIQRVTGIVLFK